MNKISRLLQASMVLQKAGFQDVIINDLEDIELYLDHFRKIILKYDEYDDAFRCEGYTFKTIEDFVQLVMKAPEVFAF